MKFLKDLGELILASCGAVVAVVGGALVFLLILALNALPWVVAVVLVVWALRAMGVGI